MHAGVVRRVYPTDGKLTFLIEPGSYTLTAARVKTGVAVSDSHTDSNPGDARSYVRVGKDRPRDITDDGLAAAVKAGHVVAASGPFLDVSIGDAGPGDTVPASADLVLSVTVQAPTWMPVDWVRVLVNGEQVAEEAVTGTDPERFVGSFPLDVAPGDWVVVLAGAPDKDLAPVSPGQRVLSIANPIHVGE